MTRLVKERTKFLTEEQTGKLLDEIKASEKTDRQFFDQGRLQRRRLAGMFFDDLGSRQTRSRTKLEAKIAINLVHAHIRSLLPTVFFREPTVNAKPLNFTQAGKEETWELVLNNTLKRNGYKKETKKTTLDALTYHEGWKKLAYNLPEDEDQDQEEGGGKGSTESTQAIRGATPWGSKEIPISTRVSPMNVIVDYLSPDRDPEQARFVAIKYIRPLSEMKADDRYKGLEDIEKGKLVDSRASNVMRRMDETRHSGHETSARAVESGIDMVLFYEVYVYQFVDFKLYRQTVWLAEGVKKPIRMETWEELFGIKFPGWPIHRLVFNPVPDTYPMAEVEVWQQLQESINWTVSKLVSFVSQQNLRYAINTEKIKDPKTFRKKLLSGKAIEIFEVKDVADVSEAITIIQGAPVSQDVYRLLDILVTFVERTSLLGQNQQQQGGVFRTATEADTVRQATQIRDSERIDVMRDFLRDDVRKLAAIIRNTATKDLVVKLAGDTGSVQWETFQPSDIEWEPDIDIEIDSFREVSQQEDLVKWIQVFQIGMQLLPLMPQAIRMDVIFLNLLKAANVADPESILSNISGARESQLMEIMVMMMGEPVEAQVQEPHADHIAAIDNFMNSPVGLVIRDQFPEAWSSMLEHRAQHESFLQQVREEVDGQPTSLGPNPLDDTDPGNSARREAGLLREASRTGGRNQEEFL